MKISYTKKSMKKVTRDDVKYIEMLNALLLLDRYGIKTRNGLFTKLMELSDKILNNEKN